MSGAGLWSLAPVSFSSSKETSSAIICYSYSGNTWKLAEMIEEETGADLFRLEVERPYAPSFGDMAKKAKEEVQADLTHPLKHPLPDLSKYDTIYLGGPVWWGSLAVPVATFLREADLDGKIIYPFITSGSVSPRRALRKVNNLCEGSSLGKHFFIPGSAVDNAMPNIEHWLETIGG